MKFSWGHGITVAIVLFVGFLLFMVWKTFGVKVDLVAENYYEQEIAYETRITNIKNYHQLGEPAEVAIQGGNLEISFPPSLVEAGLDGEVACFRPSDERLDVSFELNADSDGVQRIPASKLAPGLYQVKLTMEANSKQYYHETTVYVTK